MDVNGRKVCSKCGIEKPFSCFNKKRRSTESKCKECRKIYTKERTERFRNSVVVDNTALKVCSVCLKEKLVLEFYNRSDSPDGKGSMCKLCKDGVNKKWHSDNTQYVADYLKQYRQERIERFKQYAREHREHSKIKKREAREKNPERFARQKREWDQKNKSHVREYRRNYTSKKWKNDLQFRLGICLRNRVRRAIKRGQKAGSAVRDLGCSIDFLKQYIESKWLPGMNWENWGVKGWHIDHIMPLASFDLTNREQFLKACHYSNLQPLWWLDNIKKSDKETG